MCGKCRTLNKQLFLYQPLCYLENYCRLQSEDSFSSEYCSVLVFVILENGGYYASITAVAIFGFCGALSLFLVKT